MRTSTVLLLLCSLLLLLPSVAADEDEKDDDDEKDGRFEDFGEGLGEISRNLLIATLVLILWKPAHLWLHKSGIKKHAERLGITDVRHAKKGLKKVNGWMMRMHLIVGVGAVIAGFLHGIMVTGLDAKTIVVWAGWTGLLVMSILGGLMQWKWPPREVRKGARLLHSQRIMLVITIALLGIGHRIL